MALTPTGKLERDGEERAFLARYKAGDYARPAVAVDLVVLTVVDAELRVLLIKRDEHPFKGKWALPGGFVRVGDGQKDQGEDLDAAATRELEEETGLDRKWVYLEQLYTFGRAHRDPRMRVITVAYFALVRPDLVPMVRAGGDAAMADWFLMRNLGKVSLAFDHEEIVRAALRRVAGKLEYSDVAFSLVPLTFTVPELRAVHEIVTGEKQDPGNFRRRFNRMLESGVIEKAPGKRITASKPATVYRFGRSR
ncbi:MAG: NUDIX hydrolase [Myxococcales bacterium]|nr:NUDIX hydrolase [Myxococcales bacterium]